MQELWLLVSVVTLRRGFLYDETYCTVRKLSFYNTDTNTLRMCVHLTEFKKASEYVQEDHIYTLQTSPLHCEEEPKNTTRSQDIKKSIKVKQPSLPSPLR